MKAATHACVQTLRHTGPASSILPLQLLLLLMVLFSLTGCSDATGSSAAWAWVALAMLPALAAGYALGSLRSRLVNDAQLRAARAEARQLNALRSGWRWQTDADHQPVLWQGPGQVPGRAADLFADPQLLSVLQTQGAFSGLRVQLPQAQDGSRTWLLHAVPRQDDIGAFSGFIGHAEPADALEANAANAAVLPTMLALQVGPAVTAAHRGNRWQVQQFNAAAAARWPKLLPGADLRQALDGLPPAVLAAFDTPTAAVIEGWHLQPMPARELAPRTLVLAQPGTESARQPDESDSFSFTVSHDLRAPIRVVEGFTRIVKEDYGRLLDRVGNDHLDRVLGAAARMNLMIDALLTLARLSSQPLAHQPVNLSQLAGYVIDDLKRGAPEREAEVDIEPGLATQGDPTLLRLVLENLLGNAWKYSARTPKARISLGTVPHAGRLAYVVRDNGAGFDMRSSDRLFGLFQRLHSASEFPGHGVGLASVRRIVRRHGGDIWAEAEPGRGAAFYFTLTG